MKNTHPQTPQGDSLWANFIRARWMGENRHDQETEQQLPPPSKQQGQQPKSEQISEKEFEGHKPGPIQQSLAIEIDMETEAVVPIPKVFPPEVARYNNSNDSRDNTILPPPTQPQAYLSLSDIDLATLEARLLSSHIEISTAVEEQVNDDLITKIIPACREIIETVLLNRVGDRVGCVEEGWLEGRVGDLVSEEIDSTLGGVLWDRVQVLVDEHLREILVDLETRLLGRIEAVVGVRLDGRLGYMIQALGDAEVSRLGIRGAEEVRGSDGKDSSNVDHVNNNGNDRRDNHNHNDRGIGRGCNHTDAGTRILGSEVCEEIERACDSWDVHRTGGQRTLGAWGGVLDRFAATSLTVGARGEGGGDGDGESDGEGYVEGGDDQEGDDREGHKEWHQHVRQNELRQGDESHTHSFLPELQHRYTTAVDIWSGLAQGFRSHSLRHQHLGPPVSLDCTPAGLGANDSFSIRNDTAIVLPVCPSPVALPSSSSLWQPGWARRMLTMKRGFGFPESGYEKGNGKVGGGEGKKDVREKKEREVVVGQEEEDGKKVPVGTKGQELEEDKPDGRNNRGDDEWEDITKADCEGKSEECQGVGKGKGKVGLRGLLWG